MPPTMRAVRLEGPGQAVVRELPVPEVVDADWRVLQVERASICATDRKWFARGASEPRILGHEMVLRDEDGRLVGVHPEVPCRACKLCADGWDNRCHARYSVGLQADGALAERVAVREDRLVDLGELAADQGALLEPVACCWHAADMLGATEGDAALVIGAGAMGIISTWVLQALGARVVVMQRSPERRHLAAELGADAAIGPDDDPAEALGVQPRIAV
ncbi:hypothetical protein ER308_10395 [Egibacter rhizosphaerae]|uniref:Alcohol dehydrogenase-like N-terminal domain-containing protein n=1 Tax=Egibacter rhizosphaerae TaxID=1670831 RepID=A0A411YFH7_9ACTN|nr:alcohol dehydrogenase catalytic domain-containing protein [Egibacter rhizosphaerae]QBI19929.1 hypothetical protein ER308_10395 [Egibacter rhizosphaerae]